MSLTSLLLGSSAKAADADLDALFTRTKVEAPVPKAPAATAAKASTSKAKIAPPEEIIKQAKLAKAKAGSRSSIKSTSNDGKDTAESSSAAKKSSKKDKKRKDADSSTAIVAPSSSKPKQIEGKPSNVSESSKKRRRDSTSGADELVHETLLTASVDGSDEEDDEEDDESEDDGLPLVHESLLLAGKNGARSTAGLQPRAKKQAKHLNESKSDRDARTTFIGNVPIACATNKSSKKALVRHLIATLPAEYQSITKLDSIRFRSLQLATPAFDADGRDNTISSTSNSNKQGDDDEDDDDEEQVDKSNNHARKRARKWKTGEVDSQNGGKTPKFLTASQKKKIGFIKGQVHEKASSCIAYAVWDTIDSLPTPSSSTASTSKAAITATPQEIASLIVKYGNNTVFEGFTLRVDHVKGSTSTLPEGQTGEVELSTQAKRELALEQKAKLEEEKRTLYIGSLDFEEKEQAIRELCEKLMTEERGEPTVDNETGRSASWVERVRLVRDAETGLGKGFAYVMFKDRECVDEMLALDSTRVKLSKRKLRLERCKTSSAKAAAAAKAAKEAAYVARKEKQTADRKTRSAQFDASKLPSVPSIPKAPRPDIGDQLKSLSKEERKALKSSDDDRLTRRLEKKQAKREAIKLEKQKEVLDRKVKSAGGSSYKARVDPAKEGMRKKRMRSDNAVFAKNRKKTI